ncbi:NifU family protein [Streptomyces sp. LX-29]|uniref:NifU family protein n=1 Tax=Streptomyces sp. LX-29 TaxID=2900152 RepID=UPI00240CF90D|nr:NifU family protein [Streptomyces sp. LX-29]WFB06359.1 NifU family protein [Streptomyces sp. LX-29]
MPWDDAYARDRVARAEERLAGLETLPDGVSAARAGEAVEGLVALYGECLARVMGHLADDAELVRRLAADELVGHLLLVHDLHPDPVADRVRQALAGLPGEPEVLELSADLVRIRLRDTRGGGCGCGSSPAASPEQTVRDAIAARAPEVERVEVETAPAARAPQALIPVEALFPGRTGDRAPVGREAG